MSEKVCHQVLNFSCILQNNSVIKATAITLRILIFFSQSIQLIDEYYIFNLPGLMSLDKK